MGGLAYATRPHPACRPVTSPSMETGDAESIRAQLRETVAELKRLEDEKTRIVRRRNELVFAASQAGVDRAEVALDAELSEPMVYKIRQDLRKEREG